jgi:hypothetical protein
LRAFRKLDGKGCKGEFHCTTKEDGEIGSKEGQRQGKTLENYCHNQQATKDNGLKNGCPLYDTKPENTPPSLYSAIDTAETLRNYKKLGVLPTLSELSAWEFACLSIAESASDTVEAESLKETTEGTKPNKVGTGTETPLGIAGQLGEDSAMAGW